MQFLDTRQLEQESKQMKRIMDGRKKISKTQFKDIFVEVENDFFPYVYQKAERVFIHTLADSFLKDGKF